MSDTTLSEADPEGLGLAPASLQRLSDVFRRDIERNVLPGAVILVARKGRIGFFEALGRQDAAADTPMRRDSIFRIYSMTKPIVSVALMMLVEEGQLKLDDPLAKYLPEFAEPKVAITHDGGFDLIPAARPITIQDLLRHTSGFSYEFMAAGELGRLYAAAGLRNRAQNTAEFCRKLAQLPLLYQPGTCWAYGHSHEVIGRLIEIIAGTSLGVFLRQFIFEPLGMADTGFHVPAETADRIAEPFATDPETGAPISRPDVRKEPVLQAGGGGLVSTAMDYARFCQMLCQGGSLDGKRLLGRMTLELMLSDHLGSIGVDPAWGLVPPGHGFGLGFAVRMQPGLAHFREVSAPFIGSELAAPASSSIARRSCSRC
jgi:CubicO group peptidase (beta-lactamase class C family)